MTDSIVEEVRRVRDEHAAEFGYDVNAIVEDLRRSEAERDWPQASFAPRRVLTPVSQAGSVENPNGSTE